jgi:hypothetical protein
MRVLFGLAALALALLGGFLFAEVAVYGLVAGGRALTGGFVPPGAVRGLLFGLSMAAATAGLLWLAGRAFGWTGRRSRPGA